MFRGEPPAVRAVRQVRATDQELGLALDFEQGLEASQRYSVQISTDNGVTWHTIGVGLKELSYTLDTSQFGKGKEIQIRIISTDGFLSQVITTETFRT